MTKALELGTHRLKSLCLTGNKLVSRSARSVGSLLADTGKNRQLLDQLSIPFVQIENQLGILGDDCARGGQSCNLPVKPLLPNGRVCAEEAGIRQQLISLVESLLPGSDSPGELCGVTLPQSVSQLPRQDREFLLEIVRHRGYEPLVCPGALALAYATLSQTAFTGISACLGTLSCELLLISKGRPVKYVVLPCGGDWIDQHLVECIPNKPSRETKTLISHWKESYSGDITRPESALEKLLANSYQLFLTRFWETLPELFTGVRVPGELGKNIPLVIAGGPGKIPGFLKLAQHIQQDLALEIPLDLTEIHCVAYDDFAVARGTLIHSELEWNARNVPRAA